MFKIIIILKMRIIKILVLYRMIINLSLVLTIYRQEAYKIFDKFTYVDLVSLNLYLYLV
jgi:hypothetical protein